MLSVLRIVNLAIVEELEVEFGPGLNVLTGETGAGKSIVLKAIDLLTGKRATGDILRSGSTQCVVEGLFLLSTAVPPEIDENEELTELLAEEELLIRRTIDGSGRSKVTLNGRLSTAGMLQNLAPYLMDITGQHQQQTLLDTAQHRQLLDHFGGYDKLLEQVSDSYSAYYDAKRRLDSFLTGQGERLEYLRRITFERDELKAANLKEGRKEELEAELKRAAGLERLTADVSRAMELLEDSEDGIDSRLSSLSLLLGHLLPIDPAIGEIATLVDSAAVQLNETKLALAGYAARLEADPERLEVLRETIAEVARLERKYGKREADLVRYLSKLDSEITESESGEIDEPKLQARLAETEAALKKLEQQLTQERIKSGKKLSALILEALKPLGMKHAIFEADIAPDISSAHGADKIAFTLSANPGEPLRALNKVASGGELSRILLVLKTVLNEKAGPRTQIFDEIDVGIGGAVAQIVGEKLHRIAENAQVILVTHSAQVAAFADTHFLITKSISGSRTKTALKPLNEKERVEHIASMLAGKKVSTHFEQSARELLSLRSKS